MIGIDHATTAAGDAWLVAAVVRSTAPTPRRVEVRVAGDAPVWPPRRRGVPVAGWAGRTRTLVVPAGGSAAVGFASPDRPPDPPVRVDAHERVEEADRAGVAGKGPSTGTGSTLSTAEAALPEGTDSLGDPRAVVRTLAPARPPADAVPTPRVDGGSTAGSVDRRRPADHGPRPTAADTTGRRRGDDRDSVARAGDGRDGDDRDGVGCAGDDRAGHDHVDERFTDAGSPPAEPALQATWLAAVRWRVDRARRLADARSLAATAKALERAGGPAGVAALRAALAGDERRIRALAYPPPDLADRCAAVRTSLPLHRPPRRP